jgi:hypothetical protein
MNGKKLGWRVMIFIFVALVLSACGTSEASIPQGQVTGILTDEEGNSWVNPDRIILVLLASVSDGANGDMKLNPSWHASLDDTGSFIIEDVPPGQYCLVLHFQSDGISGAVLSDEEELMTFEMPSDSGVDLGKVDASLIAIVDPGEENESDE